MGKETSQGIHSTVSKSIRKAMRRDYMSSGDRFMNQMKALAQGKNVVFTVENPNKEETNKRFIRQKVSGKNYLNSRKGTFIMKDAQ
jgi:archaellum biogenesis ATPase FlaH